MIGVILISFSVGVGRSVASGQQNAQPAAETGTEVLRREAKIERVSHILAGAGRCAYRVSA